VHLIPRRTPARQGDDRRLAGRLARLLGIAARFGEAQAQAIGLGRIGALPSRSSWRSMRSLTACASRRTFSLRSRAATGSSATIDQLRCTWTPGIGRSLSTIRPSAVRCW